MATIIMQPSGRLAGPAFLGDLAAAVAAGAREWRRLAVERAGRRALSRLDSRLLRDMGLDPEAIRDGWDGPLPLGLPLPKRR